MRTLHYNEWTVTTTELRKDAMAALDKGYSNKFAFTPETVIALLDEIAKLEKQLREVR